MAISGERLTCGIGAVIFSAVGLIFSAMLLNLVLDRCFPTVGGGARFGLILCLGLCNCIPYLLRTPMYYEMAIISAYCFVMGGLYLVARAFLSESYRLGSAAFGSAFLGLAIGCRPHMALVGLLVFALGSIRFLAQRRDQAGSKGELLHKACALVGPWLCCVGLLGIYNYIRFDSFTEFGAKYTLISGTVRLEDRKMVDGRRLKADLEAYLFTSARLHSQFPYVSLESPLVPGDLSIYFGFAPVGGLLKCIPFMGMLVFAPLSLWRNWRQRQWIHLALTSFFLSSGIAILLFVSCFSVCMRYMVDFVTLLMFASILIFLNLYFSSWIVRPLRFLSLIAIIASLIVSSLFNIGISFEGQRSIRHDLEVRDRLRQTLPRMAFFKKSLYCKLQIQFPADKMAGDREPLVVSGVFQRGDFLFVRYVDDASVVFVYDHWGLPLQEGKTVRLIPGHIYNLEVDWDSIEGVRCRLDGDEVIRVDSDNVFAIDRPHVRIGSNIIGGGLFSSEVFTGQISVQRVQVRNRNAIIFAK